MIEWKERENQTESDQKYTSIRHSVVQEQNFYQYNKMSDNSFIVSFLIWRVWI